jgi:hypothetical protein
LWKAFYRGMGVTFDGAVERPGFHRPVRKMGYANLLLIK